MSAAAPSSFSVPDDIQQRKRTMYSTNYLRLFDRTARFPCMADVKRGLEKVVDEAAMQREGSTLRYLCEIEPELEAALRGNTSGVPETEVRRVRSAIVAQWTGVAGRGRAHEKGVPFFSLLNRALVQDESGALEHMIPFIRLLNSVIRSAPPTKDLTVWRGSKISSEEAATLTEGTVLRDPMYLAASLDICVAQMFAHSVTGGEPVLVRINVPQWCSNASVIYRLSELQEEREVLFPPYSAFLVTGRSRTEDGFLVVECEVLDNMVVTLAERDPRFREKVPLDFSVSGPVAAVPL
eukprot:TRINITY_DN1487_c0_g2_i1.p1 TRINITY_DN1487_c0_g2~~TRINITY_DN1487_c0_g2_i1.p1  ORF type:complete len:295 (+),score=76.32 TRINITY_DN1487_c0_g2_i1:79-963(+)